jgi:hypothetical protein
MARRELHRVLEALRRLEVGGGGFVGADAERKGDDYHPDHFTEDGGAEDPPYDPNEVHHSYHDDSKTQVHNVTPNNVVPNNGSHAEAHAVTPSDVTPANGSHEPGRAIYYEAPPQPETGEMLYLRDGSRVYIPPGVQRDAEGYVQVANGDRYFVGFENVRSDRFTADYDPFEFEEKCEEKLMQVEAAWHTLNTQSVADSIDTHIHNQVAVHMEARRDFKDLWSDCLAKPKRWMRIEKPKITRLTLPNDSWKYIWKDPKNPSNTLYAPSQSTGGYRPGDIWILDNIDSLISWVTHNTRADHPLECKEEEVECYVPLGLHVFKPLCTDLFAKACEDLYNLYLKEDMNPTSDISPARMKSREIPFKTMLFYSYEDKELDHFKPNRHAKQVVEIIRREGFSDLALYVMETLSAMAHATNTNRELLEEFGSVMFIRYAPGEGFQRHGDGTKLLGRQRIEGVKRLGAAPGPILNVTMGVEREKVMDFTPAMCYDDKQKHPIRVRCEPGEGILMWGESRVEWTHTIPIENTWRFTMAIKLPGPPIPGLNAYPERKLFPVFNNPDEYRLFYNSYDLKVGSYKNVSLSDRQCNIDPLPQFNYNERHIQLPHSHTGKRFNGSTKQPVWTPKKRHVRQYHENDDVVSIASTMSHVSTASRTGFGVTRGQSGLQYVAGDKGFNQGKNRDGKGRGKGQRRGGGGQAVQRGEGAYYDRDYGGGDRGYYYDYGRGNGGQYEGQGKGGGGREGRDNEFPYGVGNYSLIPGAGRRPGRR